MVGIVRTRHLVTHPRTIVHEFGVRCYLRCIWRTATARHAVTFLECVAAGQPRRVHGHRSAERCA